MKVAEYKSGNAIMEIHDEYIMKKVEEKQEILDRIGKIYSDYFSSRKGQQTA